MHPFPTRPSSTITKFSPRQKDLKTFPFQLCAFSIDNIKNGNIYIEYLKNNTTTTATTNVLLRFTPVFHQNNTQNRNRFYFEPKLNDNLGRAPCLPSISFCSSFSRLRFSSWNLCFSSRKLRCSSTSFCWSSAFGFIEN